MKNQQKFALVKLMIVLVILSILVIIATSFFVVVVENVTKVLCEINTRNIRIVQKIYYFENQEYANSVEIVDYLQNVEDMDKFKCPATGHSYIINKNNGSVICEGCK